MGRFALGKRVAVAALFLAVPWIPSAQATPVRNLAIGDHIDWSYADARELIRYQAGPMELAIRGERGDFGDLVHPVLTVAMPGSEPVELRGSDTSEAFEHRVSVGRWDGQASYLLFQSFTGGAHCCNFIQIVYPEEGRLRVVDLGHWDGDYLDEQPEDLDGDGRIDFLFNDNRFLYAFAPYAMSGAPPQMLNVVGGEVVDVSAKPSFEPLFEATMARYRPWCVDERSNGACAAYVAAAARAGRFEEAWAEMLRSYERGQDWDYPTGCRTPPGESGCPDEDVVRYRDYPEALRHFLVETGYIDR